VNILDAITMARTTGETLKALQNIDHAVDKAELKSRLADAIGNLADVRIALADTRDELQAKDAEIARLKQAFAYREALIEHGSFKYRRSPRNSELPIGYPSCPRCEEVDGRVIFTVAVPDRGLTTRCPQCHQVYSAAYSAAENRR
jgi:hypothetical protein